MPSSPAAGWIQTLSNPASRATLPFATQLSATPPAMHRFFAPVVSRSQRARASSTFSVSSCTRQARSSQCRIEGLFSQRVLDLFVPAIGREPHQLAALVPVAEDVGRGPAVERAETGHGVEFIAKE